MSSASPAGIPKGSLEAVVGIVRKAAGPIRRRQILKELEGQGRTISLAGLNRILEYCARAGTTEDTPDGVRLRPPPS